FRGTLEVFNGHENIPMRDVKLNLTITDKEGNIATSHEFQSNPETLKGFEGELDLLSGWELKAGERGVAEILFIPTRYAAPELATVWTFGGSVTYIDPFTNLEVTRKLQPVSLTVNPSPVLDLTYFLQRDVFSDDPLTPDVVEASQEAEFALVIHNVGAGEAKNVRLLTRQPEIVDNEKGVLLETSFVSSSLNGEEKHLSLGSSMATDFGTIPAGASAYGQWWFVSFLVGHFIEYDVKATHVTSYDNPDLSLLGDVTVHELIRGISDPQSEGGRRLFLANDIADSEDFPDMVYYSDGTPETSLSAAEVSVEKTDRSSCELRVIPQNPGWVYGIVSDPTGGRLRVKGIERLSDGAILPADNCWQTAMTLRDGNRPVHENKLHIAVNTQGKETYRILFEERPSAPLEVLAIGGIPSDETGAIEPVKSVTVTFNKEVDPESFTSAALKLTRAGERVNLDEVEISSLTSTDYSISMGEATRYEGYYLLTVDASALKDSEGYDGINGKSKGWLQKGEPVGSVDMIGTDSAGFRIWPVPVRGSMNLEGEFGSIVRLSIHNSKGALVGQWHDLHADSCDGLGRVSLKIEGMPTDTMIVTAVTDSGRIFTRRVLFIAQ
ncbi:MAG: hypothetical protein K2M10_04280, partial [Muribaculaceae bacterium]|nr:hypothetical protein [Muribaculaceae bacterium]